MQARLRRPRQIGAAALTTTLTLAVLALVAACGTTSPGGAAAGAASSDVNTSLGPTGTVGAARTRARHGARRLPRPHAVRARRGQRAAHRLCRGLRVDLAARHAAGRREGDRRRWGRGHAGHGAATRTGPGRSPSTATRCTPTAATPRPARPRASGVMDTGGTWYALSASGTPVTSSAARARRPRPAARGTRTTEPPALPGRLLPLGGHERAQLLGRAVAGRRRAPGASSRAGDLSPPAPWPPTRGSRRRRARPRSDRR